MKKIIIILLFFALSLLMAKETEPFKKAEAYLKEGKLEIALLFYTKELNNNLDNWQAYYHRGKIYFYKKNYDQALSDFKKAFQINSRDAELAYFLANAYATKGDTDKAIQYYKKSLKLDSHYYYAYLNLGIVYLKQKKDKKNTIKNWKIFLKKMPDYYQYKDIKKAIAYLESDDFSFDAVDTSLSSDSSNTQNASNDTNKSSATNGEKLVIPDILVPDIKGEGKKAPVSKHKDSEERKSIETE